MPANLTPQYKEAEDKFRAAETPSEKLAALEDMLRIIPKHKGTEKLQADIKRKIAKIREEGQKKGHGQRGVEYNVEKEGGGQVILVGPPNSGKSTLLSKLTKAHPEVGEYPFTTHKPLPGMMEYEDIKIQIVDMPPITEEFSEPWVFAIIRNADAAIIVVDVSAGDVLDQMETLLELCEKHKVLCYGWDRPVPADDTGAMTPVKTVVAANKMDNPDSADNLIVLQDLYSDRFPIAPVSWMSEARLDSLKEEIFRMLGVVRVYTKIPGKPADMKSPYIVPRGTTVVELASIVHKDFVRSLRFARIWGAEQFDGQMVSREHVLQDRDVIEFHV